MWGVKANSLEESKQSQELPPYIGSKVWMTNTWNLQIQSYLPVWGVKKKFLFQTPIHGELSPFSRSKVELAVQHHHTARATSLRSE